MLQKQKYNPYVQLLIKNSKNIQIMIKKILMQIKLLMKIQINLIISLNFKKFVLKISKLIHQINNNNNLKKNQIKVNINVH